MKREKCLKNLIENFKKIINLKLSEANESEEMLIEKLQHLNVLKKDIKCSKCNYCDLKLVERKRNKDLFMAL